MSASTSFWIRPDGDEGYDFSAPCDHAAVEYVPASERDALTAQVVRLKGALGLARDRITLLAEVARERGVNLYAALNTWPEEIEEVLAETPEASLARLKARWQAEILNEFTHGSYIMPASLNLAMSRRAKELRRQAEGGDSHDNQ